MSYSIGSFGFVRWEGPRPQYVVQHTIPFSKPGQDGTSLLHMGHYGNPFQVELTAVFANETLARASESSYRNIIGTIQVLIYEGVNYNVTYATDYMIQSVSNTRAKRNAWLCGPTYVYPGGWQVMSSWNLIPRTTIP